MRRILVATCALMAATATPLLAQVAPPVPIDDYWEIQQHLVSPGKFSIPTEWIDARELSGQTFDATGV